MLNLKQRSDRLFHKALISHSLLCYQVVRELHRVSFCDSFAFSVSPFNKTQNCNCCLKIN
jgi:hypothetical protein